MIVEIQESEIRIRKRPHAANIHFSPPLVKLVVSTENLSQLLPSSHPEMRTWTLESSCKKKKQSKTARK
jgi:hypothetical protein